MNGFIKIHRRILEWDWYKDIKTKTLFLHLLLKANFKEKSWQGVTIYPGQLITGRKSLSQETGLSEREIRTSLSKLEKTGEIAIKATSKYSIISICKWGEYQVSEDETDQQTDQLATSKRPTSDQQATTTEEGKEGKNENKGKNYKEIFEKIRLEFNGQLTTEMIAIIWTWLAYKSERGESYKPTGMRQMIINLLDYSSGKPSIAKSIINRAIGSNHAGFFPLQNNSANTSKSAYINKESDFN